MGTGSLLGVKSGRGMTLTPHPLLVPWSRKDRAIPLLPLWAIWPVQGCISPYLSLLMKESLLLIRLMWTGICFSICSWTPPISGLINLNHTSVAPGVFLKHRIIVIVWRVRVHWSSQCYADGRGRWYRSFKQVLHVVCFLLGNSPGGLVWVRDMARVRVKHRMAEVRLLCYRWLSPFLKLV